MPKKVHPIGETAAASGPPGRFEPDWYLKDWLRTLGMTQADLVRATGWSKATANDIYHGKTRYYRQIVNEVANALGIPAFELFLPPAEAMAMRRIRESARAIAAEARLDYTPEARLDGTNG